MFNDKYGLTKAVLEGRKTMTRRFAQFEPIRKDLFNSGIDTATKQAVICEGNFVKARSQYRIGEVVAIAQSYRSMIENKEYWDFLISKRVMRDTDHWIDTWLCESGGHSNKMFVKAELMPHHIQITGIRVEQLQDITDEDCLREGILKFEGGNIYGWDYEGVHMYSFSSPCEAFSAMIDRISGLRTWHDNPHVFVYEFKLID